VTTPLLGQFVVRRLGLAMFNPHIKFEMSTITCNEETKGNAKCKNSRFEPPFGGLRGNAQGSYGWKAHCRLRQWCDTFTETNWMRKGPGPGDIIGTTERPQTTATWVFSMDATMTMTADLKKMSGSKDPQGKNGIVTLFFSYQALRFV